MVSEERSSDLISALLCDQETFKHLLTLLNPTLEHNLPAATRDAFRHCFIYESVAREKYIY